MLTFAFLSLPLLRKTDVKIRKQTEKRETKRKQETVFYVFLRMSLANIGKFKLSLKALILSVFTFICFLVFSNVFCRTKIFFASCSVPGWATKNWLPTLFADSLGVEMSVAGPIATITIAFASFIGVMVGGPMADRWALKNLKGRIYTSAIGLALMIPSLVLMGFGTSFTAAIAAGMLFGLGYGLFDANNMPILCQFVPDRSRGTAYGMMNMSGLFIGALATNVLGSLAEKGMMGLGFACMAGALCLALILQLSVLKPKTLNME